MTNLTNTSFCYNSKIEALKEAGFSKRALNRLEYNYYQTTDTSMQDVFLMDDGKVAVTYLCIDGSTDSLQVDVYRGKSLRDSRLLPYDCRTQQMFN